MTRIDNMNGSEDVNIVDFKEVEPVENAYNSDDFDSEECDGESYDEESDEFDTEGGWESASSIDVSVPEKSATEFAQDLLTNINLGDIEVVSNTDKGGLVRYVPISRKDNGMNMYVVMDSMKNQLYLKENKIRYPSGKSYTKYTARVKPDEEGGENQRPENPKKQYMVDVFNAVRRSLIKDLRGYIKVPDVEDQKEYRMSVRHKFDKIYNILSYDNRIFSLKKGLTSHILRDCRQRYIICLQGMKITSDRVYIIMRLCRTVVDKEIVSQLRFHNTQLRISKVVNSRVKKNIDKLRKTEGINLKRRRYVRKAEVAKRLNSRANVLNI
jgi:hypothetical protein